ncbi:hypothetical protein C5689_12140 [Methylosinus sporium]|uniref:DUF2946 domain-containing protein n=1 Tax=Methylosinus sporium TaxID=428 RepID=A0A2U1SPS1_METSR|nr:hypothetical protein C5689_12140 [Methylosinus sporium]
MIAGLLAWALVLSGMAAASAHMVGQGVAAADFGHCAAPGGSDDHRSPGLNSCSCCIPCRSSQLDSPTGTLSSFPKGETFSFPAAAITPIDVFQTVEKSSPAGWISSWSSRAPPAR